MKRVVERTYYEIPPGDDADQNDNNNNNNDKRDLQSKNNLSETKNNKNNNNNNNNKDKGKTCKPQEYVVFLKTHKTGSSTITNILNRYADNNNKTVLLPKDQGYYSFDWPNKFRLASAAHIFHRPNFLANHARYSRKSLSYLFPHESTFYIR